MAERVATGGTMEFDYSGSGAKLSAGERGEIREAYRRAEERKRKEKRNKIIFLVLLIVVVLAIVGFVVL